MLKTDFVIEIEEKKYQNVRIYLNIFAVQLGSGMHEEATGTTGKSPYGRLRPQQPKNISSSSPSRLWHQVNTNNLC